MLETITNCIRLIGHPTNINPTKCGSIISTHYYSYSIHCGDHLMESGSPVRFVGAQIVYVCAVHICQRAIELPHQIKLCDPKNCIRSQTDGFGALGH